MSFLDSIRDKILSFTADEYRPDYEEGDFDATGPIGSGLLGNVSRPEADSVAVYTRTGQHVSGDTGRSASQYETVSQAGASFEQDAASEAMRPYKARLIEGAGEPRTRTNSMNRSGQLPPYVFRPQAYEDVQTIFRRVKTNQPVVLNFVKTDLSISRRVLDFCFGFMSGVGGSVEQLSQDVYVLLPPGITLSASDMDKLQREGVTQR